MSRKILITGGAGFVGSHLADALLSRGDQVRVFDNLTEQVHQGSYPSYLSSNVEFMAGDMTDQAAVSEALAGIDAVFHLAAAVGVGQSMYQISHYMASNTLGTANLLQALLKKTKVQKLVAASSMSIYGEGKYLCANCGERSPDFRPGPQLESKDWEVHCPTCDEALTPIPTSESKPLQCASIYALSKKDQEEMCLLFGRTYKLPVVALRYFNIYGPRQALSNPYTGVAAIFASRLLNDKPPLVFEDGKQMRDFVSVHDVVAANLLALDRTDADGCALNIGSGNPISVREIALSLSSVLGAHIPASLTGKYRAGDIRHCFADISLAKELLGFEPKMNFSKGMQEFADWLRSQQAHDHAEQAVNQLQQFGLTA